MATQKDMVLVDLDNGTFMHIEQVALVDLKDLTRGELDDFNNGYDGSIIDIAEDKGTSVMSILENGGFFSNRVGEDVAYPSPD